MSAYKSLKILFILPAEGALIETALSQEVLSGVQGSFGAGNICLVFLVIIFPQQTPV